MGFWERRFWSELVLGAVRGAGAGRMVPADHRGAGRRLGGRRWRTDREPGAARPRADAPVRWRRIGSLWRLGKG